MKYYLYDRVNDSTTVYRDWWDLIGAFYDEVTHYNKFKTIDKISHNKNDRYHYIDYKMIWDSEHQKYNFIPPEIWGPLPYIIYDEYDRIINKAEIKESCKIYNPEKTTVVYTKRKYRTYRSNKSWMGYRENIHRNKRYVSEIMEHNYLFPCSGRTRKGYWFLMTWNDDIPSRSTHRNWKCHSKKKKQWM